MGRFLVRNLFSFYLLFELRLIPILLIIIFWGRQPERISAGVYFLIYTRAFSIPVIVIVLSVGRSLLWERTLIVRGAVLTIRVTPFLVKLPVLGLHFWLPKAHVEARTRGSMILAGLLLKLGGYGLLRVLILFSRRVPPKLLLLLTVLARVITLAQSDIKKLIAYSRVTHIRLIAVAPFMGLESQVFSLVLLSLAHGWASAGIFLVGGTISHASHSRSVHLIWRNAKVRKIILALGVLLVVNASIPPMPSFFSEVFLVIPLLFSGALIRLFVIVSLLVCYYNVLMFTYFFQKKPSVLKAGIADKKSLDLVKSFGLFRISSLFWLGFLA
jgi:NADH-ubiquinone oxidoreductase chain 4